MAGLAIPACRRIDDFHIGQSGMIVGHLVVQSGKARIGGAVGHVAAFLLPREVVTGTGKYMHASLRP